MTDRIEIRVPDIGDFSDIPVIELLVGEGDRVDAEDGLITLESDKATMEVPSPAAGVIRELKVKIDDTVSEGDVVAILEAEAAGDGGAADSGEEAEEPQAAEPPPAEAVESDDVPHTEAEEPDADEAEDDSGQQAAESDAGEGRPTGVAAVDPSKVPYASPVVRRYARELGVDLDLSLIHIS